MKRLELSQNNAHTPTVLQKSNKNSNFDITKLLQILPNLNLDKLFNNSQQTKTLSPPPEKPQEFIKINNFMQTQNLQSASKNIQNHRDFMKKFNEQK